MYRLFIILWRSPPCLALKDHWPCACTYFVTEDNARNTLFILYEWGNTEFWKAVEKRYNAHSYNNRNYRSTPFCIFIIMYFHIYSVFLLLRLRKVIPLNSKKITSVERRELSEFFVGFPRLWEPVFLDANVSGAYLVWCIQWCEVQQKGYCVR